MRRINADQSRKMFLSASFIFVAFALSAIDSILSIGPRRALPHGSAMEVNCSLPCIFRRAETEIGALDRRIALSSRRTASDFFGGSSIARAMPSMSQPRISFRVSQVPSSISFLVEMAGPMVLPEMDGPGKTFSIA